GGWRGAGAWRRGRRPRRGGRGGRFWGRRGGGAGGFGRVRRGGGARGGRSEDPRRHRRRCGSVRCPEAWRCECGAGVRRRWSAGGRRGCGCGTPSARRGSALGLGGPRGGGGGRGG